MTDQATRDPQDAGVEAVERVSPGRPLIGRVVNVRMDETMITQVEAAAEAEGVSRAEWVRRAINTALAS